jgi:hypothetical protein
MCIWQGKQVNHGFAKVRADAGADCGLLWNLQTFLCNACVRLPSDDVAASLQELIAGIAGAEVDRQGALAGAKLTLHKVRMSNLIIDRLPGNM